MQKTQTIIYRIEEKLCYLEDISRRNNLRIEDFKEEEGDDGKWDHFQKKVSSILKFKLKINNVNTEQTHRMPKKKSDKKNKPRTIIFKLHSDEDKRT